VTTIAESREELRVVAAEQASLRRVDLVRAIRVVHAGQPTWPAGA
jgi:hypothetical protein